VWRHLSVRGLSVPDSWRRRPLAKFGLGSRAADDAAPYGRDGHIWPLNWENAVLILPRLVHQPKQPPSAMWRGAVSA